MLTNLVILLVGVVVGWIVPRPVIVTMLVDKVKNLIVK